MAPPRLKPFFLSEDWKLKPVSIAPYFTPRSQKIKRGMHLY